MMNLINNAQRFLDNHSFEGAFDSLDHLSRNNNVNPSPEIIRHDELSLGRIVFIFPDSSTIHFTLWGTPQAHVFAPCVLWERILNSSTAA